MAAARVHVNGVTYVLRLEHDAQSIGELATKIEPRSHVDKADGGGGGHLRIGQAPVQRLDVLIEGAPTSLVIRLDRVWASAAWLIS